MCALLRVSTYAIYMFIYVDTVVFFPPPEFFFLFELKIHEQSTTCVYIIWLSRFVEVNFFTGLFFLQLVLHSGCFYFIIIIFFSFLRQRRFYRRQLVLVHPFFFLIFHLSQVAPPFFLHPTAKRFSSIHA